MKKGNKYMNKDGVNKVVNPSDFDKYLAEGWIFGNTKCKNFGYPAWNKGLTKETSESVMKISKSKTGVKRGEEFGKRMSEVLTGRKLPEEVRRKISESNKGHVVSEETRKKISQARMGHTFSPESRKKISETLTGRHMSEEARRKISLANRGKTISPEQRKRLSEIHSSLEFRERINNLKRERGTFNTSDPEEIYYRSLVQIYGEEDIVRQYRDKRYPFSCDFYIKSLDKFIELNLHWTHGDHPFDSTSEDDLKHKKLLESKAETSQYYANALYVWTDLDVRKQKIAKKNNLNYEVIYSL